MQDEPNSRIQKIRSKVHEERALLSILENLIADESAKKHLLRTPLNLLEDVETFFLNTNILQEPRSPSALAKWLGQAEKILRWAAEYRKFAERTVETFGPSVRTIPS